MQAQEISIANPLLSLTISEQLVFLIQSTSKIDLDYNSREHYLLAVITGCFADLFLQNKINFANNVINLNNNPKQVSDYLTDVMKVILSYRDKKSILYLLLAMNDRQMSNIESKKVKELINKKLLVREHKGVPIFGEDSLQAKDTESRFDLYNELKKDLNSSKEPPMEKTFLLTLLDEINFLPDLFESRREFDISQKNLALFINHDHIAKLLLRAIQNELKLNELSNMPKHRGGGLSIGRIF